jgi:hypothetical protein
MPSMTEVTIVNTTEHPAHFTHHRTGPATIPAKERTRVGAGETYMIVATLETPAGHLYRSNSIVLADGSQTVTASEQADNPQRPLEIAATPGPVPNEIRLINHCAFAVTFMVSAG